MDKAISILLLFSAQKIWLLILWLKLNFRNYTGNFILSVYRQSVKQQGEPYNEKSWYTLMNENTVNFLLIMLRRLQNFLDLICIFFFRTSYIDFILDHNTEKNANMEKKGLVFHGLKENLKTIMLSEILQYYPDVWKMCLQCLLSSAVTSSAGRLLLTT